MSAAFAEARRRLTPLFEAGLSREMDGWVGWPSSLAEPARYVLSTGGKRVRPLLALMAAEAAGGAAEAALPWAVALELLHTYSLVHDDLPCMDDDEERRGQPTCHVRFGEAAAVLVGDALLTEAFGVLSRAAWPTERTVRLTGLLARAAGGVGMVGGQAIDTAGAPVADVGALEDLHRRKTGALIRAAAEGGAVAVGAKGGLVDALARYGAAVGLLFQITDDLLDRATDEAADRNCYFAHQDEAQVLARRDTEADVARTVLAGLGPSADALRGLAAFVATRTA